MTSSDDSAFDDSPADHSLPIMGWREWLALPDLGIQHLKAKIDTGARSSSLHAFAIETFTREGDVFVKFQVHPAQRSDRKTISCEAKVHDVRHIRSSSGESQERIVILTNVRWKNEVWQVEMTLADRSQMGFRMLVGREAMRGRILVHPGKSYFGGRPKRKKKKKPS